ncbi:uncharacterized protein A1O9_01731 [Exophiala aquamarina CBS 119918]|uniref:Nonribosomal peptide synthetase sidC n=1 Tax=Exophiala aquamarina CBS 119918 TaxID=1182545 RepID=A0A072PWM2_9EURO|nr:uncharacterized protein A1O9_01731 [Exophiala aquamarina CBS 119918]KEF63753.1 hypothetical protein A1O9_01731 [Exophiala aquamarina CBS 119918]
MARSRVATATVSADLAIVNQNRQTLQGPSLLHELIASSPLDHDRFILDYLSSKGQRIKLNYAQFHRLTDTLAKEILTQLPSCETGDTIIPAIIPQCPELYIAWTSVLKAGAGYCPVSLDVPAERLKFIVKDVHAPCVLTLSRNLASVQDTLGDVKCIPVSLHVLEERLNVSGEAPLEKEPLPVVNPDGPAYVMYTSGSTGLPKGVKVSHLSVSQSLLAHDEHIPPFKRFFQFASPTFDVSIFEIFFPFFRGATLVSCERERMLSDLPAALRELEADAAELTPTVAGTLLRTREAAPCLRILLTIGEMLTRSVVSEFGGTAQKPSMLYAMYGPTEAAIHCTLAPRLEATSSVRSIGRPFSTVTTFILKEADGLEIARIGEPGELAVSGQLADGYLNRPDQNSAAFVELPGYGPVYKTGDRAICQLNGDLEILGRMSAGQVKIRGQRVELGEIEEVASKAQGVDVAVASVIDDILVLFCAGEQTIDTSNISSVCKSWLPSYMRPGEVMVLQAGIPRLPSGKIDRKKLESDFRDLRTFAGEDDDFKDDFEHDVLKVLRNELRCHLHRSSSLWSLGLDSLLSIKVASILRGKYPDVSAAVVAEAETVAQLSATIQSSAPQSENELDGVLDEAMIRWKKVKETLYKSSTLASMLQHCESIIPCSSMQIAMLLETTNQGHLNFNEILVKLASGVTIGDLRQGLQLLARQNEILRSGFISTGDQAMPFAQIVWHDWTECDLSLLRPLQLCIVPQRKNEAIIRIHHALYDGWSWELIMDDLNLILSRQPLPTRTQFSKLYESQLRQMSIERAKSTKYWHTTLEGFVHSPFPNLSSVRHVSNQERISVISQISIGTQKLSNVSRLVRCSRETILESAWAFLLSSYTDTTDLSIGVVSAGRHLPMRGIETIIGPCLATLPLRIDFSTLRTVHDLIDFVQRQRIQYLKNGSLSLLDIHRAAGIQPGQRLFDTLCVWQEDSISTNRDRSKVSTINSKDSLDYTIILEFEPRDSQLLMKMTFDSTLIPESHAVLLGSQMDYLVSKITADFEMSLDELWRNSDDKIMSASNTDYEEFNEDFHLVSTIAGLAQTDPERTAVEFVQYFDPDELRIEKKCLTYGDLYMRALGLASTLRNIYTVQQDELICIFASKSTELYIGILGVILAGAAYLCVDVRTPVARLGQILQEAHTRIILTDGCHDSEFRPERGQKLLRIRDASEQGSPSSISQKSQFCIPENLAYAVFTSGSTGVPKGVLITRRNLLSNLRDLSSIYPSKPGQDRLLQACSPAFDVSVFEIFWTWHRGMTLCTAPNDILFKDIEALIHELQITHLSLTPSVAALINPQNVPLVKMLVTAGEPMNSKVFSDWAGKGLYQGYGPSETTNICNVRPAVLQQDVQNNVGPALANASIFVCERQDTASRTNENTLQLSVERFRLLPTGAIGEIWVGGEQVGRGYIDHELTARSFLSHPRYGRLYRSGDIGRLLVDDTLVIAGREDDQVKLRGQRLELGEINSSLLSCEFVNDAVSMIIKGASGNDRLISFWSTQTHPSFSNKDVIIKTHALFELLGCSLPTYMVPDTLIYLERIPLTRQGKTDRRALADVYHTLDPEHLQQISRESKVLEGANPLSGFEKKLANVVCETLQIALDNIGRNSSFFALGLDSISAIHLMQSLKKAGLLHTDVSTILRNPSIGQLTLATDNTRSQQPNLSSHRPFDYFLADEWKAKITAQYAQFGLEIESLLPCTPLQEFMAIKSTNSVAEAYENILVFRVNGDLCRVKAAWDTAMRRHQLLRTGFVASESAERPYVQVVLKQFRLPWLDGHNNPPASTNLDKLMLPPWRIRILQNKSDIKLVLEIHHVLYDAEAMSLLQAEIQSAYQGRQMPPPVSFNSYIHFMESLDLGKQDDFWQKQLHLSSPCRLGDMLRPQDKRPVGRLSTMEQNAVVRPRAFREKLRKLSTTSLSLLQTVWSQILLCIFQKQDVCFGTVLSGRNLPIDGVESIVGPCFNTIPTRVRVRPNQSAHSLCQDLQQTNIEILPFQPSSLRRIQNQNGKDGRPLFDTLILLQQSNTQLEEEIWTLEEETGDMEFPFILEVCLNFKDDCLTLKLHSTIAQDHLLKSLLQCYDTLLDHVVTFPHSRAVDHSAIDELMPEFLAFEGHSDIAFGSADSDFQSKHSFEKLSETEEQILRVIRQLKPEVPSLVAKDTTIFRLGLDSINTVQISTSLRELNYAISSGDILEAMTIRRIAELCSSEIKNREAQHISFDLSKFNNENRHKLCAEYSINEADVQAVRPCTSTQSGILSQFLRTNGSMYFNTLRLGLNKSIDITKLESSWNSAVSSHEMLRTGFVELNDPTQPFAMVTYCPGTTGLPWSRVQGRPASRSAATNPYLEELTTPPWHLTLVENQSGSILEVSMLHALYDASSLDIILHDVACLYWGMPMLQPRSIDVAITNLLSMANAESSEKFWSSISSELCSTKFPNLNIFSNSTETFHVVSEQCEMLQSDIKTRCAKADTTLQALFAAAWSIVLSAYTAQEFVTFGVVLSGRNFETDQDNNVAFPCINTVPFTLNASGDLVETLKRATRRSAAVTRHQHTSLNSIKRSAGIEGELFDTVIALQNYTSDETVERPWHACDDEATAEYALSLEIFPTNVEKFLFQLTYREDLMPSPQASCILTQFSWAVNAILSAVEGTTRDLDTRLFSIIGAKDEKIATEVRFLHEFVEATAKDKPNSPALEFVTSIQEQKPSRETWSYTQLDCCGNQIAHLLIQRGVRTSDLVAVCFDKCPEAFYSILGVLKSGCGYLAIDPSAPEARKTFILNDSRCKFVLTTPDKVHNFPQSPGLSIIAVDDEQWRNLPTQKPELAHDINPQDTCYCLYTSGTTGTPKGCLISHDSAVQAMLSFQRIFKGRWESQSRWLQFAAFHFDVSVLEQYWSWSVGICVTSIPRDLLFEDLPGTISALNITHLDLTPSLARLLTPQEVPSLCRGVFIVGGEQLSREILETWGDSQCLYNFYGPSEVTIGCTVYPNVPKTAKPTNIGQQWDNVGSFVLRPGTTVPVLRGAVGELCLSGPLVGKGYLNRPELSAEKFIMLEDYEARIYRTGDLVRVLHNNSFDFLGRVDDQVKLRGQRLEIGEINHVILRASSDLKDVTTMVLKHPLQRKDQLVTFFCTSHKRNRNDKPAVIKTRGVDELIVNIKERCTGCLPAYMVPTYYFALSVIPLTINNKVDLKCLKALFEEHFSRSASLTPNENGEATSQEIAILPEVIEIVASFLKIPVSTIQSSSRLFELGLDSVSAIGLSRAFKKRGFEHTSVATILKHPSVVELAQSLNRGSRDQESIINVAEAQKRIEVFANTHLSSVAKTLGKYVDDIQLIAPCTPLQEGMLSKAVGSYDEGDTTYFSKFHYVLDDGIDLQKLRDVWTLAEQSIAILRTYFVSTVDGYAQVVLHSNPRSGVQLRQLQNGKTQFGVLWDRSFADWTKKTKSFTAKLPWKVDLITFGRRKYMSLQFFHGLYDGISLNLVLETIKELYVHPEPRIEAEVQFFDALPYGPLSVRSKEAEFWNSKLPTVMRLNLSSKGPLHDDKKQVVCLQETLTQAGLSDFCNKLNVTVSAFFQASWLYVLYQVFGINPTIGVVVSGRALALEGAEAIIGPMFNTIPFAVCDLSEKSSFPELVQRCSQFNIESLPFHHTSLRQIARHLGQDVQKGLFEALFVFQKAHPKNAKIALWHEVPTQQSSPEYPLNLEVEQDGDQFKLTLLTKPEFVDSDHAEEILEIYLELVRDLKMTAAIQLDHFSEEVCRSDGFYSSSSLSSHTSLDTLSDVSRWSEIELMIRTEVAQLASIPEHRIGKDSPTIFEMGLDSIEAMKLAARLRQRSARIPTSAIMKSPTVAGIASQIGASALNPRQEEHGGSQMTPIADMQASCCNKLHKQGVEIETVQRILPVTPMQEGLLLEPGKYFNVLVYRIRKDVDIKRLHTAWENVCQSEAILRTRFAIVDQDAEREDLVVQYVTKNSTGVGFSNNESLSEIIDRIETSKRDLTIESQTLHLQFVNNGEAGVFLVFGSPHALYDAWSLHLLHEKVSKMYHSVVKSSGYSKEVSYERHIQEVIRYNHGTDAHQFWQKYMQRIQPCISAVHITAQEPSIGRIRAQCSSNIKLVEALKFCQVQGVTLQSLGLTIWTIALAHVSKCLDVCFGLVLSGRTTENSEDLIFPTFNTVVFAPNVDGNCNKVTTLKAVHDTMITVSGHQHFPLRDALRIWRTQHQQNQLFDTLFTFQKLPIADGHSPVLYDECDEDDNDTSPPYPINVEFEGHEGRLRWTIAAQEGLMDLEYAGKLINMLNEILLSFIHNPSEQFIHHTEDGASICGLPPVIMNLENTFKIKEPAETTSQDSSATASGDWSLLETRIRDVLAKVSKIDQQQISKSIGFYHLGLDSVSAIRIASLLKKDGVRLPVSEIVKAQTVEKMALVAAHFGDLSQETNKFPIGRRDKESKSLSFVSHMGLEPTDFEQVLPVTAGQTYMLDMWSVSKGRLFYPTFWLRLSGTTSERIHQSMKQLTKSMEMLRTKFIRDPKGNILSLIIKEAKVEDHDLPWSFHIQEQKQDHLLTLKLHHALYDAVSLHVVFSELRNLCQYSKHEVRVKGNLKDFISETHTKNDTRKDFWFRYLTKDHEIFPVLSKGSFETKRVEKFDSEVMHISQLQETLRYHGISIQALLFAVYARVYASRLPRRTDAGHNQKLDTDVIIGVYLANRSIDIDGLTELAAPTLNIVPLRIQTSGSSIIKIAQRVQRDLAKISRPEHCSVSMREIYAWTGIKIDTYVNFLSLPGNGSGDEEGNGSDTPGNSEQPDANVSISHVKVNDAMRTKAADIVDTSPFFNDAELLITTHGEWCLVRFPLPLPLLLMRSSIMY